MKPKLSPDYVTIAMVKDPTGSSWLAEIHIEYKQRNQTEVTRLTGDSVMGLLSHCHDKLQKKLETLNTKRN